MIPNQKKNTNLEQFALNLSAEAETGHYLVPDKWGWFSVLQKHKGYKPRQTSYRLRDLPVVLPLLQSNSQRDRDNWITQAVFRGSNRRKVNLAHVGTCFVDLDYYNTEFAHYAPEQVLELVLRHCEKMAIPLPSVVIDSGRGLQIKWYHNPLPRAALPRWDSVQLHLCLQFSDFGSDRNARDASRVLRVVRTINQKNGLPVSVIWQQADGFEGTAKHYSFEDLASSVLPVNRGDLSAPDRKRNKRGKASVTKIQGRQSFTLNSLNWSRMEDILKLNEIRGGFADGLREPACFWACNFYGLRYAREIISRQGEYQEFASLCRQIAPHWDISRVREKTGNLYPLMKKHARGESVEFQGRQYPPLYTPNSQFLIDAFGITDDEQRQLGTIHSDSIKREKDREKKREVRQGGSMDEYNDKRQDRKREVIRLLSCGFRQTDIAKLVGVSKPRISKILKELKKPRKASDSKGLSEKLTHCPFNCNGEA